MRDVDVELIRLYEDGFLCGYGDLAWLRRKAFGSISDYIDVKKIPTCEAIRNVFITASISGWRVKIITFFNKFCFLLAVK